MLIISFFLDVIRAQKISSINPFFNTCAMDAIIQAFSNIAGDCEKVKRALKADPSETSNLIIHFLENGADASFYKKKRISLGKIFGTDGDCKCNISTLFANNFSKKIFHSFGGSKKKLFLPININVIEGMGIENLYSSIYLKDVTKLNDIIIIEICYIEKTGYELDKVPKSLNLLGKEFTLKAFINFIPPPSGSGKKAVGHYQSYNFRPDGQICLYDNQSKHCKALATLQ